jgi:hypothetical protein
MPGLNEDGSEVDRVLQRSPSIESGRWFGEDQRANVMTKDTCSKEIGLRLQILITTPHSIGNTVGRVYVSSLQNQQNQGRFDFQSSFYCRFVDGCQYGKSGPHSGI